MKKSQVSVFIIFGLILLVVIALAMYVYNLETSKINNYIDETYLIKATVDPVKSYVENCLELVGQEPIRTIGQNGGTLDQSSSARCDDRNC